MTHFNSYWTQDPESHKSMTSYFTLIACGVILSMLPIKDSNIIFS